MSEMDLLTELIKNNHTSTISAIGSLKADFVSQRRFCDDRFDTVEIDVKTHDRCLSRYKGIIKITCAIWGAICAVASCAALIIWG